MAHVAVLWLAAFRIRCSGIGFQSMVHVVGSWLARRRAMRSALELGAHMRGARVREISPNGLGLSWSL